jgi:hypothetical protein
MAPHTFNDEQNSTGGTNGSMPKRPIRVAGCSAGEYHQNDDLKRFILTVQGVYDRKRALHDIAQNEEVDVITGDWMSECNMTVRGQGKRDHLAEKESTLDSTYVGYEESFVEKVDAAIPWLAKKGIKLAVNAGASDVAGLAEAVKGLIKKHAVNLKVGYVDGDDVTDAILDAYRKGMYLKTTVAGQADGLRRTFPQPAGGQGDSGLGIRANLRTVLPRW